MKQYDEGEGENPFGINNGRISKLTLVREDKTIANYDRGWDIRPKDKEAKQALALILNQYN